MVDNSPHDVLLVLDGSTGQNAFEQAKQFTAATEVTSLAVTKLDGTAKEALLLVFLISFKFLLNILVLVKASKIFKSSISLNLLIHFLNKQPSDKSRGI